MVSVVRTRRSGNHGFVVFMRWWRGGATDRKPTGTLRIENGEFKIMDEKTSVDRSEPGEVVCPADTEGSVKRLDIYVVDSGWNLEAKKLLDDHLSLFKRYLEDHNVYVLDELQATEFLKQYPAMIGEDPVLIVWDSDAHLERRKSGCGFRLCLGALRPRDNPTEILRKLLRMLTDRAKLQDVAASVRDEAHRAGVKGAFKIIDQRMEQTFMQHGL